MAYRGKYKPKNPEKYVGDVNDIVYRSLWERRFMVFCDTHPDIILWNSESVVIPYIDPTTNRKRRYFPDFLIRKKNKQGEIEDVLIEVKPYKQCFPPKKNPKHPRRFITESKTYSVNQAKWAAAREMCRKNNMKFEILTEKQLKP